LLGAEEFGFATAPLVVAGCIMMRVCHLDTCPVGVATQNPVLRARFNGRPEFVENFFRFIAEDVRRYLAELGFRSIDEAVGHTEVLDSAKCVAHWKSKGLDLTPMFAVAENQTQWRRTRPQDHGLEQALDRTLIALAEGALEDAHPVRLELPVRNVNRTVGTLLGSEVTRRYGANGLPDDTIHITLTGSAGQSIGAFLPRGITLELIGDANDYVGKGLSGGRVIVRPPDDVLFLPEDNVIAGNTLLFGATSGEVYLRGRVGERFAARNSGALTVVEGVGDHACEYMTGGRVVVLGKTGRNMAAGMSGGIAFVLGLDPARVNTDTVELQRLDPEDLSWLRGVIANHAGYTGSTVAKSLLSDWPRRSAQFTKVMPTDYQRVLQATRMAKAEGRDVDTAIMEASRG
jgi:glutamate synthase (NADPH) large chain